MTTVTLRLAREPGTLVCLALLWPWLSRGHHRVQGEGLLSSSLPAPVMTGPESPQVNPQPEEFGDVSPSKSLAEGFLGSSHPEFEMADYSGILRGRRRASFWLTATMRL